MPNLLETSCIRMPHQIPGPHLQQSLHSISELDFVGSVLFERPEMTSQYSSVSFLSEFEFREMPIIQETIPLLEAPLPGEVLMPSSHVSVGPNFVHSRHHLRDCALLE